MLGDIFCLFWTLDFTLFNLIFKLAHLIPIQGEWVADWRVQGATKEDFQRFGKAQTDVFGRASFGWAYWAFKNANTHWSLEWMIKNGYIKL